MQSSPRMSRMTSRHTLSTPYDLLLIESVFESLCLSGIPKFSLASTDLQHFTHQCSAPEDDQRTISLGSDDSALLSEESEARHPHSCLVLSYKSLGSNRWRSVEARQNFGIPERHSDSEADSMHRRSYGVESVSRLVIRDIRGLQISDGSRDHAGKCTSLL